MNKILTIAASDSGGGAGIQADIKTITVLGGYAMSAVTALTAQNTTAVEAVHPVPGSFVGLQIDTVLKDLGADAAKTGMLVNAEIISAAAQSLKKHGLSRIVVDPVLQSTTGSELLDPAALGALKEKLLPICLLVTPNLDEAAALTGTRVDTTEKMKAAAGKIHQMGAQNVLIKGGHLEGDCVDLFYDGNDFTEIKAPRIDTKNTHGTGCTFSAAIATELAAGRPVLAAVRRAKDFITTAIRFGLPMGRGAGPVNPAANLSQSAQAAQCAAALESAFAKLQAAAIGHLIPEIQSNLGYAAASARAPEDVVAFPGRIIKLGETISRVALPAAGASRHIARIILTALRHDPGCRACMNIIWTPEVIERCRDLGYRVGEFDRKEEPPDVKEREGSSLEWGTQTVIEHGGGVPDIIFDRGDIGKEPVTRVLGTDPMDVADKIIKIADTRKK